MLSGDSIRFSISFVAEHLYSPISVLAVLKIVRTVVMLLPSVTLEISKIPEMLTSGVGSGFFDHVNDGVGIPKIVHVNIAVAV